jgi:hypothetical protein
MSALIATSPALAASQRTFVSTGLVLGSAVARSVGPDFDQGGTSVLRSSGNNTRRGRGLADISGTITSNPLK